MKREERVFSFQRIKRCLAPRLKSLIDEENLRVNFGEEAKRSVREKYTSSVCAKKMLEVYEKTIKGFSKVEP